MLDLFAHAAGQVIVMSLVLGAGLPALFAVGIRLMVLGGAGAGLQPPTGTTTAGTTTAGTTTAATTSAVSVVFRALGIACFVAVLLAVALGITMIVASGFGMALSFETFPPTLVDK